eukprot:Hpha_TRINITY_DN30802_c0_g1::TRINITY_DN30802_c0_g1_i1::g.155693::m.155693
MKGCCGWLLDRLVREGDTVEDVRVKQLLFPVVVFLLIFAMIALIVNLQSSRLMFALGNAISLCGFAVFLFGTALNAAPTRYFVDALLLISTLAICVMDVAAAALSDPFRDWTFVVLLLDVALLFSRDHIPLIIIPLTLFYLGAEHVESAHRYGLYQAGYWGMDLEASSCNCASPPCTYSVVDALQHYLCVCSVFVVDFHFTRGFSNGVRLQLRRVRSSVEVSMEITAALARYDVDVAEEAIRGGEDLPEE